ncbi:gliding motility-associated C-terminal domain-containing protein [Mucilaginibacter sp. 21P]|uniref:gliding motility-associated C-terminal domain-containing protein n=1 Tax=Mucilaginibacter sp. 21P TaxID=2778902 RepID=UPI001C5A0FA7|nr:gliding motility-associated C-terminal domain-containing protein [Mucilaginibacter sp. 21P]QXV65536.1 gliding motility-associated C-terminal domain-containing protein [Mucilaginibacter sp. 21P]
MHLNFMYARIFILFLCIITFSTVARADTFTVTSNADSGPGTLREALTLAAANGSTVKDYIYFNLPDLTEGGRTITVNTQLPQISSNVEIDGTTQPGPKIGLSDSKITLRSLRSQTALTVLTADGANNISIYGVFFSDSTNPCLSDPDGAVKTGISIKNCSYFTFGEAGRGNIVNGYKYTAIGIESSNHIVLAGNIFGVLPYSYESVCSGGLSIKKSNFVDVGKTGQGNIFFSGIGIEFDNTNSSQYVVNVIDNNFAVMADGKTTLHSGDGTYLQLIGSPANPSSPFPNALINIQGNLISHFGQFGGIVFTHIGGKILIKHNWFGTDRTATQPLNMRRAHPGDGYALYFNDVAADITVGDIDPAMANKISYAYDGILASNVQNLLLLRNSFKCIGYKDYLSYDPTLPKIVVTKATSQFISGKTEPMALVDVFTSDDCVNCSPQTYIGSTNADAAGNWTYTFSQPYAQSIIANAHIGKRSTNFTKPEIDVSHINITYFDCGVSGKISGIVVNNTQDLKWVDQQGNVVSTNLILEGVPPGRYKLIVGKYCTVESEFLTIGDSRPQIIDWSKNLINPSCGSGGAIKGIFAYTIDSKPITYRWVDQNLVIVGNTADLSGVGPGKYTMIATTPSGCESQYGPVIIVNADAPVINTTNKQIQKATCDNYNGAITGITATGNGTLTYKWTNEQDQLVGGDLDLMGVGPGKYKLTVTSGACSPVATDFIEISSINGVSLNTTNVIVRSQTACAMGQITGLSSPDATSFTWRRKNSTDILSSSANLLNVPAGEYELTIANAACTKAIPFSIAYLPPVNFSAFPYTSIKSCQAFGTGSIVLNTSNAASQPIAYRWVNQLGQNVGFDKKVTNLPAGRYKLFATDYTGCETSSPIQEVIIDPIPAMDVIFGAKHDIYCGVGKGSIDAPVVSGGRGSYIYIWKDASGNAIAPQTKSSLTDLAPGYYSLEVLDKDPLNAAEIACNSSGVFTYRIEESNAQVPAPVINDKEINYKGNTILAVENPYTTAIYRLYDSDTAATPIDEQQGGKFSVNVSETRSYWVGLTYGSCESARTKVTIKLLKSTGLLPNAFTPNGDGINDTWMLANMDINIINTVKVFNRNGQAVFESRGYTIPFDGNYNGKQLAAGVYYYIIDLKKGKPLSGHVTIIR